jgi:hypothetical protein
MKSLLAIALLLCAHAASAQTYQPLGAVLQVVECRAAKRSLTCTVRTTTHVWRTDVTGWPGDNLQVGDTLSIRTDKHKWGTETWLCKTGTCRAHSVCYWWMPCAQP